MRNYKAKRRQELVLVPFQNRPLEPYENRAKWRTILLDACYAPSDHCKQLRAHVAELTDEIIALRNENYHLEKAAWHAYETGMHMASLGRPL